MHWVRNLALGLFVVVGAVAFATAQQQSGRSPRASATRVAQAGRASRNAPGQLGVQISLDESGAVRVDGFSPRSSAEQAGIRAGDRIVAAEGRAVQSVAQLVDVVRPRSAGTEVKVRLRRTVVLQLDERQRTRDGRLALGLVLGGEDGGLQVSAAPAGYAGAAAGMEAGDRILELDGRVLANQGQLVEYMRKFDAGRSVRVTFERDLRVRLGAADALGADVEPAAPSARRATAQAPRAKVESGRDVAGEVAALRRELAALRAELAELRQLLADD